jgi:type VI secretion system protein VasD
MKTHHTTVPVRFFLLSIVTLFIFACAAPPPPPPKPHMLQINISASSDVNPDIDGRPSPVILHVLELSAIDEFNKADFFALTANDPSGLGGDVINKSELILTPGSSKAMTLELKSDITHMGFVAGYRDIDNARWRVSKEVSNAELSQMNVVIGNQQISIN